MIDKAVNIEDWDICDDANRCREISRRKSQEQLGEANNSHGSRCLLPGKLKD
jgi:hypothetical protein